LKAGVVGCVCDGLSIFQALADILHPLLINERYKGAAHLFPHFIRLRFPSKMPALLIDKDGTML